ncbi:MAG: hypothetical protein U9Q97_09140 [Acidobacteriota bacterium]|nr:hypothetical protein [Acidobacteriota bacterium]
MKFFRNVPGKVYASSNRDAPEGILNKLQWGYVFSVKLLEDKKGLTFTERCNNYFGAQLSKTEVKELIDELTNFYKQMKK